MSHPIHILKHEHRVIEQGLRALNGVCLRLASGQWIPPGPLSQLLDFIRVFADQYHHGKEEAHFFPVLERRGIRRADGPLGLLTHQHEVERELSTELCLAIEEYADADPKAYERFITAANRYIDLMVGHMETEDRVLFRLAEEILDEKDKAELSLAFKQAELALGSGALEKYEQIAAGLEREWTL